MNAPDLGSLRWYCTCECEPSLCHVRSLTSSPSRWFHGQKGPKPVTVMVPAVGCVSFSRAAAFSTFPKHFPCFAEGVVRVVKWNKPSLYCNQLFVELLLLTWEDSWVGSRWPCRRTFSVVCLGSLASLSFQNRSFESSFVDTSEILSVPAPLSAHLLRPRCLFSPVAFSLGRPLVMMCNHITSSWWDSEWDWTGLTTHITF